MNTESDNFDWQFYLQNYEDLRLAGINTQHNAQIHWLNYGKNEGRKSNIFNVFGFDINIFRKFNKEYINLSNDECINLCKKTKELIFSLNCFYNVYCDFNIKIYKKFNNIQNDNELDSLYNFHITKNKDEIIYSLNTFYHNYPKFNYYLYRKTNNIKNIGEVDTIINWYMNGCDYSFLINKNVVDLYNKWIIVYPHSIFDKSNGGVVAQYYLANIIDLMGLQVRIHCSFCKLHNDIFTNYYNNDCPIDENVIVVYCEGISGNPLNAKNVVRWLLSELGKNVDKKVCLTWKSEDLVYYFNYEPAIFYEFETKKDIYKVLSLIYIDPLIKNNHGDRSGYCFTMRKMNYHNKINYIHPVDSFEITRRHTQNDYVNFFNKYEYFISYDPLTFLNVIACLCGCISIVYPIEGKTKNEWLKTSSLGKYFDDNSSERLYGIAYGNDENEINFAKNTLNLVEQQWKNIQKYFSKNTVNFIDDMNNIDICNNKVKNIFKYQPSNIFDWKTYVNNYVDLQRAGIDTEEKAISHWNMYGKNEGRIFQYKCN